MPADRPTRVLVVDDHPVVRDGLAGQLSSQPDLVVAGQAGSAEEALAALRHEAVDVVLTDLRMPGAGGIALIAEIGRRHPGVQVVVLTTYDTAAEVSGALAAGARGYLLKDAGRAAIADAVRAAHRGRSVLAPGVRRQAAEPEPAGPLSPRELEVLRLVAAGRTNAQIGAELHIGESTVKTHLQHVFDKLAAADRAAAVAIGYRRGLLD